MSVTIVAPPAAPDGSVPWIDVSIRVHGLGGGAGAPMLKLPLVAENTQGVADALQDLVVTDARGPLGLTVHDDEAVNSSADRHWIAERAVDGDLTVNYRVPITNAPNMRGAAPATDIRSESGAFSGAGQIFIMRPESSGAFSISIHWRLKSLGADAIGVSSFGVGDITLEPGSVDRLSNAYLMGGRVGRYTSNGRGPAFISAWQGDPPYDAAELMRWTERLHTFYLGFFHDTTAAPYVVFMRANPITPGSGIALPHSFLVSFGARTREDDLKFVLAHEMLHTWVFSLSDQPELQGSWFGEGIAVYYERELPLRAGVVTPDEFLADLNETAGRYYTDILNRTPNAEVPGGFWRDTRIRTLPYDRGSLYFAVLDSQIRTASHGARNLDDLILQMLSRRQAGQSMSQDDWVGLLQAELGPQGPAELNAMLNGELQVPDSNAFGPCFERTSAPLRRYELGFDPVSLTEHPRIVSGLIRGSAADRAGLRNGDEILRPVAQDTIQGRQDATITLQIRRGAAAFDVTYLPRGETVNAFQWRRVTGVPDSECARRM